MSDTQDNERVIIVGGGISGLRAALKLQHENIPYLLLEKEDRIGGRIRTDSVNGYLCDRGFQVLLPAYEEAKSILDYSKLNIKPFQRGARILIGKKWHTVRDPLHAPFHAVFSAFSPIGTLRDKMLALHLESRALGDRLKGEEDLTTREYLKKASFSSLMMERFFEPFFSGVFLERELRTESTLFAYLYRMFAESGAIIPEEGMEEIPKQLASRLHQDNIRTSTEVREIHDSGVTLSDGTSLSSKGTILAVEETALRRFLKLEDEKRIRSTTCYYISSKSTFSLPPILHLFPESPLGITNLAPLSSVSSDYAPERRSLFSVSITHSNDRSFTPPDTDQVISELQSSFPKGEKIAFEEVTSYTIHNALPESPLISSELNLPKNTSLAGDVSLQGSINGALKAGKRAADEICTNLSAT